MADHSTHDVPAMDYAEHENTFKLFGGLMKWGTVFSVVFVLFVGAFAGVLPWAFTLILSILTAVGGAAF